MVQLEFSNADALPKVIKIKTRKRDVPNIMLWYNAYYSGDVYAVRVDGKVVTKDENGEMIETESQT